MNKSTKSIVLELRSKKINIKTLDLLICLNFWCFCSITLCLPEKLLKKIFNATHFTHTHSVS